MGADFVLLPRWLIIPIILWVSLAIVGRWPPSGWLELLTKLFK